MRAHGSPPNTPLRAVAHIAMKITSRAWQYGCIKTFIWGKPCGKNPHMRGKLPIPARLDLLARKYYFCENISLLARIYNFSPLNIYSFGSYEYSLPHFPLNNATQKVVTICAQIWCSHDSPSYLGCIRPGIGKVVMMVDKSLPLPYGIWSDIRKIFESVSVILNKCLPLPIGLWSDIQIDH